MQKNQEQNDRRKFLVGMGVAGATAVLAGPAMASSMTSIKVKWQQEHEVVIIGSGFAGLAAAIRAKQLGAKDVVIYEQMPYLGGNSAINGGLFAAPGTPLQKKEGVEDSPERMAADQVKAGGGVAYAELLLHVAKRANEA